MEWAVCITPCSKKTHKHKESNLKLSQLQIDMLKAEKFNIDGWNSNAGKQAASELQEAGYVTCYESGDEQYTCLNYNITGTGCEALKPPV